MITIGIPTLNGPGRLERALKSIAECTKLDGVRVLVCDDGSDYDQLQKNRDVVRYCAQSVPQIALLENGARCGIAASWNRLVRHYADTRVAVLLNDDIEVVDHWLEALVFSVQENQLAGMVSLNSYVGLIKSQLVALHPDVPAHVRSPRIDYHESHLLDGGGTLLASQGACFAFRRDVFDMVGGFDERYFCFYEELDFGVMLGRHGVRSFIADYPVVYHMGGATTSEIKNMNAQTLLLESRSKFQEKWGATPGQLREELRKVYVRPALREWNTSIANSQD